MLAQMTNAGVPSRSPSWMIDNLHLTALAPALLLFVVIFVYPIALFISTGLTTGLENAPALADLLTGKSMLGRLMLMSISLGICTTIGALLFGYPIAYYLARSTSRWRHYVFVAIFAPLLFSIVIRTFGWIALLGSNGLVNSTLLQLGAIEHPVVWLYNFPMTVVGLVHVFLPFMVLSILSSLSRLDRQTEEAASILGADPWRVFRHVTLPLSAQGIFGGCAIVFSLTVGAYVTPRLLGGGRVQVLATEIYAQMLEIGDWGMAALLGTSLTLVTLLGIGAYQLAMRRRAGPTR
jgi:putative spermidine/putrescine transport system permease protein